MRTIDEFKQELQNRVSAAANVPRLPETLFVACVLFVRMPTNRLVIGAIYIFGSRDCCERFKGKPTDFVSFRTM